MKKNKGKFLKMTGGSALAVLVIVLTGGLSGAIGSTSKAPNLKMVSNTAVPTQNATNPTGMYKIPSPTAVVVITPAGLSSVTSPSALGNVPTGGNTQ